MPWQKKKKKKKKKKMAGKYGKKFLVLISISLCIYFDYC